MSLTPHTCRLSTPMALLPQLWSWTEFEYFSDFYGHRTGSPDINLKDLRSSSHRLLIDSITCIFLSTMTAFYFSMSLIYRSLTLCSGILAGTSLTLSRLIARQNQIYRNLPPVKHRTSAYAVGSLVLFLLFAAGTTVYCARAVLSMKQLLCFVRTLESGTIPFKLVHGSVVDEVSIRFCNGTVVRGPLLYKETPNHALSLAFGIIAQLILTTADGLLVRFLIR
jgi:hypothetical protein